MGRVTSTSPSNKTKEKMIRKTETLKETSNTHSKDQPACSQENQISAPIKDFPEIISSPSHEFQIGDVANYFLMRHSVRADQVGNETDKIVMEDDPGLNTDGENVAFWTGQMVASLIKQAKEKNLFDKDAVPLIMSS